MGNFSKEVLAKKPIPNNKVMTSGHWFTGQAAIDKVEELEGALTLAQKKVLEHEGFVDVPYLDSKGIWTIGVGQTEKFKNKTFKESFLKREQALVSKIPKLAKLSESLQAELMQSAYRGGITGSPLTIGLINAGDLKGAAVEFLRNDEFTDATTSSGIKSRMQDVADALSSSKGTSPEPTQPQQAEEKPSQNGSEAVSEYTEEEERYIQQMMDEMSASTKPDVVEYTAEEEEIIRQFQLDMQFGETEDDRPGA